MSGYEGTFGSLYEAGLNQQQGSRLLFCWRDILASETNKIESCLNIVLLGPVCWFGVVVWWYESGHSRLPLLLKALFLVKSMVQRR